jgi:hypothetical protein
MNNNTEFLAALFSQQAHEGLKKKGLVWAICRRVGIRLVWLRTGYGGTT